MIDTAIVYIICITIEWERLRRKLDRSTYFQISDIDMKEGKPSPRVSNYVM